MKFLSLAKIGTLIAILAALMFGLGMVQEVVRDRNAHRNVAVNSVANSIAGNQTVVGPMMHSACVETWDIVRKGADLAPIEERREFMLMALPETLSIQSNTAIAPRSRGLFPVNVFTMKAQLQAQWPSLQKLKPVGTMKNSRITCGAPMVMLAVADPRGVRSAKMTVDGNSYTLKAGTFHPVYSRGVHAMLPDALRSKTDLTTAHIELELVGTERLSIVPLGDTTQVRMQSNWPHPSFGGRFAPADNIKTDKGFDATWRVTSMASSAGQSVLNASPTCANNSESPEDGFYGSARETASAAAGAPGAGKGCAETLQISFIDPVNPYSLSDRATKYGLLFVVLTFVAVGLFELMNRLRVHPIQYFLVGSAISIFFLLLVSLSEHLGFNESYAAAATACVLLLTYYASYMLGGLRRGVPFGLGVGLLYGLLFVLLQLEQTALVVGAIALFVVLALVMALTRKIDWYRLSFADASNRTVV